MKLQKTKKQVHITYHRRHHHLDLCSLSGPARHSCLKLLLSHASQFLFVLSFYHHLSTLNHFVPRLLFSSIVSSTQLLVFFPSDTKSYTTSFPLYTSAMSYLPFRAVYFFLKLYTCAHLQSYFVVVNLFIIISYIVLLFLYSVHNPISHAGKYILSFLHNHIS